MNIDTPKNVPTSSSQPSAEDPSAGSTSSVGGEIAKNIATVNPDVIGLPLSLNNLNGFDSNSNSDLSVDPSNLTGGINQREINNISDLLEGSNKYIRKCSLNDIMFLVMLIMTKSATEQRASRFEGMISKKTISSKAAINVYEMKMSQADSQYKAEKKQAEMQIIAGAISIATGIVSCVTSALSGVGQTMNAAGKAISAGLQMAIRIANTASAVSSLVSSVFSIAQGFVAIDIAKDNRKAEIMNAEAERTRAFFDYNMKQVQNMQEAYSTSQRNVSTILDSIREALQQKQDTRLGVTRNI